MTAWTACTGALRGGTLSARTPQLAERFCLAPLVTDARTGKPVPGATAAIRGVSGVTNNDGYAYLNNVVQTAPGETSPLSITAAGYQPFSQPYAIDTWACDAPVQLRPISSR